jgi:hypothetical protein
MGFAAAALLPIFGPEALHPAAWAMTAGLLVSLGRDWLVVCGYAAPEGKPHGSGLKALERTLAGLVPVLLRAAVAAGVAMSLWGGAADAGGPLPPGPGKAVLISAGALCVLGVAARCAAMILSLLIAAWVIPAAGGLTSAVTLAAAVGLLLTGAGTPRVCQPEDRFLTAGRGHKSVWELRDRGRG